MKKNIMISVLIIFILVLAGLLIYANANIKVPSISLPLEQAKEEESPKVPSPTPAYPKEVVEIENDLKMIEADLDKVKEDSRLNPPSFIFSLGISK
jgi:hypothetical protein